MYKIIEDADDFLLINKQPGVSFHREGESPGLVETLKSDLDIDELFTLHRLDKITSGLIVFAKNRDTAREFSAQFRKGLVEKYYLALTDRRPQKRQGLIKGDMVKSRRGSWKLSRTKKNPAITQFFSSSLGKDLRVFLIRPRTGKTHQIRVAMKSIGAAVLGDPLYHRKETTDIDRAYLHSYAIRFRLAGKIYQLSLRPDNGRYFTDENFINVIRKFENPWELKWPSLGL